MVLKKNGDSSTVESVLSNTLCAANSRYSRINFTKLLNSTAEHKSSRGSDCTSRGSTLVLDIRSESLMYEFWDRECKSEMISLFVQ